MRECKFITLLLVISCSINWNGSTVNSGVKKIDIFPYRSLPHLKNSTITLGGFSGLHFEGKDPISGRLKFTTVTDRGPNGEPEFYNKKAARRFALPDYQPMILMLDLDESSKEVVITEQMALHFKNGEAITGLCNTPYSPHAPDSDEVPLSAEGKPIHYDSSGLDMEGITRSEDGRFWITDEYRPSILEFASTGALLSRFIPYGSTTKNTKAGIEALPSYLMHRQMNRGFEGIAYEGGKIFAFLQSPLQNKKNELPIVEFDINSRKVTNEYTYPLNVEGVDKIGDAVAIGKNKFLVIEQNSLVNANSNHKILEITLNADKSISKREIADLVKLGLGHVEKFEGITVVDSKTIAVLNDNDFAYSKPTQAFLALIHLTDAL
jgi:3-phytase